MAMIETRPAVADGVREALRSATGELEERVWQRIINTASIAGSVDDDRQIHGAIMSDIRLILSEAAEKVAALVQRERDRAEHAIEQQLISERRYQAAEADLAMLVAFEASDRMEPALLTPEAEMRFPGKITMPDGVVLTRSDYGSKLWEMRLPDGGVVTGEDEGELADRFGLDMLFRAALEAKAEEHPA